MTCNKANKSCCCGNCQTQLRDINIPTAGLQPLQQFCCSCVPQSICMTLDGDTAKADYVCKTKFDYTADNPIQTVFYQGQVFCNGAVITLDLDFRVTGSYCQLCVTSPDSSLINACIVIGDGERQYDFCCNFIVTIPGLNLSGCGDGSTTYADLILTAVDRLDTAAVVGCSNCTCVCRCACITVIDNLVNGTERVCAVQYGSAYRWTTSTGYVVELAKGYDGCCTLNLVAAPYVSSGLPINKSLDFPNGCPSPSVQWDLVQDDSTPASVFFECLECEECGGSFSACCNRTLPKVLTATITDVSGCACADGLIIPLVNAAGGSIWNSIGGIEMCSNGGDVVISLGCGGSTCNNFTMFFEAGPCSVVSSSISSCSCDPLQIVFDLTLVGLSCCALGVDGGTIQVTVTE